MKVCTDQSCKELTKVMMEAINIVTDNARDVPTPSSAKYVIVEKTIDERIQSKLNETPNINFQEISVKGDVDMVFMNSENIDKEDVKTLNRGKVCNVILGDISDILIHNSLKSPPTILSMSRHCLMTTLSKYTFSLHFRKTNANVTRDGQCQMKSE